MKRFHDIHTLIIFILLQLKVIIIANRACPQILLGNRGWINSTCISRAPGGRAKCGDGSFYNQIPSDRKIGIDISPDSENIIQMNFLTYFPERVGRILVVGNPPFGRVSSLAVKFFNHVGRWEDVIAFIIPRTFRRLSVQNKLDLNYHLIHDSDIPTDPFSFYPKMYVKCCFQIWERNDIPRKVITLPTSHHDWTFLGYGPLDEAGQPTPPDGAERLSRRDFTDSARKAGTGSNRISTNPP